MTARRQLNFAEKVRRHDLLVGVRQAERGPVVELDTVRRTAIHSFIRDHVAAHGYSPTVREVQAAVGLRSPSTAAYQIDQLAERGILRYTPGVPRSIVLLGDPCTHCGGTGKASGDGS